MQTAVHLDSFDAMSEPIPDLLDRVAAAGYDGVEFTGLDAKQLKAVAEALGRTGLAPVATHVPLDRLQGRRKQVVRELKTVGCERAVVPTLHEAHFESEGEVARMATRLSALGGRLAADGRQLCYHNGVHELEALDGDRTGFDVLADRAGEGLAFELDVGAVVAAERDPVAVLGELSGRVPLVQLRDVDASGDPVDLGSGYVDVGSVADAAREAGTGWLVHEPHDPTHPAESLARGADALASLAE